MPSHIQQPAVDHRYPVNDSVPAERVGRATGSIPNGPSQRPGRGVFTNSGRRVHEGQRHGDNHPPRLPARNSSPITNVVRSMSSDRGNIGQMRQPRMPDYNNGDLPNSWAKRHTGNPDWSYSSSESSQKPIDQLRNRVRQQQERENQLKHTRNLPPQSNPPWHSNEGDSLQQRGAYHQVDEQSEFGFHKVPSASQHEAKEHSRHSRDRNRRGQGHGVVTSEISRSPSEYKPNRSQLQQQTIPFKARVLSPQRPVNHSSMQQTDIPRQQQHSSAAAASRPLSPDRPRVTADTQQRQFLQPEARPAVPYITRTLSPNRAKSSRKNVQNRENWSIPTKPVVSSSSTKPEPAVHSSQQQNLPNKAKNTNFNSPQQRKTMTAKEYTEHPKASASNKYKMLVCPDFFPVAKLNGFSKRKSRFEEPLVDDVFVDPPAEYSGTQEIGGFYSQKTSRMMPTQPIVQADDSFVEDPREQLLYPPNKSEKRTKSQAKDSADFYFEVTPSNKTYPADDPNDIDDRGVFTTIQSSPSKLATEGDSLYSIHSTQQVPESGTSLQSSHTSEGSQSSSTMGPTNQLSSPPAYHQALQRSQVSNHIRNHLPTSTSKEPPASQHSHELKTAQSEEYLEYCQADVAGQRGQTATVLAHIEPADIVEGSHYSTVSVYRKMQSQPPVTAAPFKPAWQQKSSTQESSARAATRHTQPDEANARTHYKDQSAQKPSVSPRNGKHRAHPVFVDPLRQTNTHIPSAAERKSAASQLALPPQLPPPNHSRNLPETSRRHDDKLLERIKAQSSVSTSASRHQEPVYERIPVKENFYENLPHFEPINVNRTKPPSSPHQLRSVTNPDYIYPPAIVSQSEPVKHSHNQSAKIVGSRLTQEYKTSESSSQSDSHTHSNTRTNDFDQSAFMMRAGNQLQVKDSYIQQTHPLMSSNRATSNSSIRDHSSTTGSVTDESLGRQKTVNFAETPELYVQSMESIDNSERIEGGFIHSETFEIDSNGLVQREQAMSTHVEVTDTYHGRQLPATKDHRLSSTSSDVNDEEEINRLIDDLATGNRSREGNSKGLGDDILSITKMWKNLPTNDSWDDKRQALLGDPIMSSITEKMEAILQASGEVEDQGERTTLSVHSEALSSEHTGHGQMSPQSPSDVGLVTREPGEGSSDDLDESADLTLKNLHHRQLNQSHLSTPKYKHTSNQSRSSIPVSQSYNSKPTAAHRSGIPTRHKRTETDQSASLTGKQAKVSQMESPTFSDSPISFDESPGKDGPVEIKVVHVDDSDEDLSSDLFKVKRQPAFPEPNSSSGQPLISTREMSDSEESGEDEVEDIPVILPGRQDESDDSDDQLVEDTGVQYLSDYHRMKARSKQKKKISFSADARKPRPGDLMTSNQSQTLLSVNPFMTSSPTSETSTNNLLSLNPFMSDLGTSATASPDSEADHSLGRRPKQGILKRSDDNAGSQLSLAGTCSEFGSHISLASGDSGMSRAGSFPLLTMSDGSKKDFKITFNDTDTHDMGNLFKVVRKARSEGAASEPESTDSDSDDDAMPVVCKNCQSKQPLFKARLVYKMCHGCYTYYCSSDCRRQDWTAHKPLCIVSRLSSLARKIFKCVMTDQELLHHCSRFARTGYLCEGRGAVVLSFSSPRKAQLFLSNAKQAKESALYLCVKDLQKFSFDDKRDRDQLISNCKHYNPDEKFVLHLAIKMTRSLSGQTVEPRIRGREFHKWARIRLSERHNVPKGDRFDEEDTLILTAHSSAPDQSNQFHSDVKAREVFFATVVTKLRKRGISLRHQYPDVYTALCQYVTNGRVFAPISLFAFNLNTQKRFMCCIMPYSDPDVTWGNNPHLMEDLDLVVNL